MIQPPIKQLKTPMMPSDKTPPSKNYVPYENPENICAIALCPNFSTAICNLCDMHCQRIHKGNHTDPSKNEIRDLIAKYTKDGTT